MADNYFQIGGLHIKKGIMLVNPSSIGSKVTYFPFVFILMALICFAYAIFMKVKLPDYDAMLAEYDHKDKKKWSFISTITYD